MQLGVSGCRFVCSLATSLVSFQKWTDIFPRTDDGRIYCNADDPGSIRERNDSSVLFHSEEQQPLLDSLYKCLQWAFVWSIAVFGPNKEKLGWMVFFIGRRRIKSGAAGRREEWRWDGLLPSFFSFFFDADAGFWSLHVASRRNLCPFWRLGNFL